MGKKNKKVVKKDKVKDQAQTQTKEKKEKKGPTKREKTAAVLVAANKWYDAYIKPDDVDQETYDSVCEVLAKKINILRKHTSRVQKSNEPHPGGIYYTIEVAGRKVERVRCKLCGAEMKPSGFSRHYDGVLCKAKREEIMNDMNTIPVDDEPETDEEAQAVQEAQDAIEDGEDTITTDEMRKRLGIDDEDNTQDEDKEED